MKVGDLVRVKCPIGHTSNGTTGKIGIILSAFPYPVPTAIKVLFTDVGNSKSLLTTNVELIE